MYKKYQPNHLYQNNITMVSCPDFNFAVHYAEQMNQTIPEFLHRHDLYEIYYVTDGSMQCWCAGESLHLYKGDLLFLGKNLDHHMIYNPSNQGEYFVLIFDVEPRTQGGLKTTYATSDTSMEYCELEGVLKRIDKEKYVLSPKKLFADSLITSLYEEQTNRQMGWNSVTGTLYYQFFVKALRLLAPEPSRIQNLSGYMNVALTATKYIHANYSDEITLEEIASLLNVTPRHINRLFQDMFGTPFARTVNIIRMHYSKQYLVSTDKSIELIADQVGLPSSKALTKLFKDQEGITPVEYRFQHRKNIQK
ncbi:helix-turn-helix domain-containing protein [Anoxybacterium hadale]|uniref:helix-turn-helix domain-containing protein n=1 Tax=Anoxybacterium hadale TaxID=3408580 RepID=UPI003B009F5D